MIVTADKIHDGKKFLATKTAIELSKEGTILAIHENYLGEQAVHYDGIICPGFVNVHCHLELSHLKGFIPKHTGLVPFLLQVIKGRSSFNDEEKNVERNKAYETLWENGVSAVGDISNTTDCLDVRALGKMHIHSFVEAIGFNEAIAQKSFEHAFKTYETYQQQHIQTRKNSQSIVPHAPYSVSKKLFGLINEFERGSIISIHNQETKEEDLFYKDGSGRIKELLNGLGIDSTSFRPSGKSSLQTYTEWLNDSHPIVFVHDSFSSKEDVSHVMNKYANSFFCLCPNANLYIENTLPDVTMLMESNASICIGTDSLASNDTLCIYSELQTLYERFHIDWETLLRWGCHNGAQALQIDNRLGSFEIGKNPGVVVVNNNSVKRIV